MKKLHLLLLLVLAGVLRGQMKFEELASSKIIYEDNLCFRDLSEEGIKEGSTSNNVVIQMNLNYENKTERLNVNKDASLKEIKAAKASRLARMKDYYYNKNKDISSNINMDGKESLYISKYAPYIEYEYSYETFKLLENKIVNTIEDSEYIDSAYIGYSDKKVEDDMRITLYRSNGLDFYDDRMFTGDGVTVGILETGIMDVNHENFANTDCEYFDNFWRIENVTEHAIYTSNLIGGSKGILPDARILSAEINGTYVNEIEWFLEEGADIINMSFTRVGTYGTRDSGTKYLDYIVANYDVTIVASAGNNENEDYKVSNPGCGYNIITVGALNDSLSRYIHSSYAMNTGLNRKPTVVALGTDLAIAQQYCGNGTSFSCAAVTGMIGMLFEAYPYCSTSAALTSLFLCTTANMTSTYARTSPCGFDYEIGAGLVDINNAVMLSGYEQLFRVSNVEQGDVIYQTTINIPANYNFRMGLSRYYGDPSSEGSELMLDLTILLYDENDQLRFQRFGTKDPVFVFEKEFTTARTFTVKIYAQSDQIISTEDIYFVTNLGLA